MTSKSDQGRGEFARRERSQERGFSPTRAVLVMVVLISIALLPARDLSAQSSTVPSQLQAEFLAKLAGYDRNFAARAGAMTRVLLVTKGGNAKSELAASTMKASLAQLERFGKVPHEEAVVVYESAASLAKRCREERVAVVYITPGFDEDIAALKAALTGVDVLSVSALPEYVTDGIVLGFELQSGKPRIVLNYEQAKLQNIDFSSDVLKLMKAVR